MKKETVGILTFHQALNYGAVLQAYALKTICEELGYEVHVVNYNFDGISEKVAPFAMFRASKDKKRGTVKLIRSLMSCPWDKKREREFRTFRNKYLSESVACSSPQEINALNYDFLISGSDQIWNYKITGDKFDPVFFLDFETNARKVIYAASSQDTPFPLDMELKFKQFFGENRAIIGIREQNLAKYVAEVTGESFPVVLDPTLLAGKKIMSTIPTPKQDEKPYILLYQIDSNPASDISVKKLEQRFRCKVYTMTVPRIGSIHGRRGSVGPEKFLALLKGAKFLVTNSFHGIALSLIFEKQFFVYENGGVMSRIDGLLEQTKLLSRKIKMVADINPEMMIDYQEVMCILNKLQKDSYEFLIQALAGKQLRAEDDRKTSNLQPMLEREKKDCCGCSACADACPVGAIDMASDEEGFMYPVINQELCIKCGKCDKVCGFHKVKKREKPFDLPKAYGLKHKDLSIRKSSRSGAAFIGFSDEVLKLGGVVYGAAMQEDFSVKHIRATTISQRDKMKKAKYVQSNTIGIYPMVEADLKANEHVLFSGTPCQIAGLKSYLCEKRINTEKLVCCDIVCHGVPSPEIWQKYLKNIEKKFGRKIVSADFRDKNFGWDSHCETFELEAYNKKVALNDYTDLFYQHIMLRPSCHNCPFANVYRPGDITLADFWGIEKQNSSFNDNKGVSLVLINTQKGAEIFEKCTYSFDFFACDVENCMQPTLFKPSIASSRREEFWNDYQNLPFDELLRKYTVPLTLNGKIKKCIKKLMYGLGLRKHP